MSTRNTRPIVRNTTLRAAALALGFPPSTMYYYFLKGMVPHTRMAGFILVNLEEVKAAVGMHPRRSK